MNGDLERVKKKATTKRLLVVWNPSLSRRGNSNPNLVRWHLVDVQYGLAFEARNLAEAEAFVDARCMEVAP